MSFKGYIRSSQLRHKEKTTASQKDLLMPRQQGGNKSLTLHGFTCMSARPMAASIVGFTTTFLPFHDTGVSLPLSASHDGMIRRYPEP